MVKIRRAEAFESEALTNIAARSEAYWGYDSTFMKNFKRLYRVTEKFIIDNPTYAIVEGKEIIGFYGILSTETETSLEFLYIEPTFIGKGYGKLLWTHMVSICRCHGIKEIALVTSPQAKEFYSKMGAKYIGDVDSIVAENKKVPKFIYKIEK
ncbi:GNAT family N-acetyltransferase [Clostridium formicaceticum]|uniref:Acetyltransferase (GNAT) family protein n=1 Tax=Clostridium formicaceticum TaxID=1497 RepID=A0AAC9RSL2_9CLOT|nr:GNAT family N-acetyltransferase [Clostridium formicaceticum]AOY74908.1 GNAT family N-acetyltransferase [Clostridium formicaceticum]ARE89315.1 Acetyltransferase (GNAT) family protein [Clostridium formicaceticum]